MILEVSENQFSSRLPCSDGALFFGYGNRSYSVRKAMLHCFLKLSPHILSDLRNVVFLHSSGIIRYLPTEIGEPPMKNLSQKSSSNMAYALS
jgi:hypothetical protein